MLRPFKDFLKAAVRKVGYDIVPIHWPPGTQNRPVGNLRSFLEDLRARGVAIADLIDVGANRGDWSALVLEVFPDARVYLLEPMPDFRKDLQRFISLHPSARYFPVAAGAQNGTLRIYNDRHPETGGPTGGSTFLAQGMPDSAYLPVQVRTIDDLVATAEIPYPPQLIKADVQGYELEVCKGAQSCFGVCDLFILEISLYRFWGAQNPLLHEVIAFMADRGYFAYDVVEFHRRKLDGSLGQIDICFCRVDSPLRASNRWDP